LKNKVQVCLYANTQQAQNYWSARSETRDQKRVPWCWNTRRLQSFIFSSACCDEIKLNITLSPETLQLRSHAETIFKKNRNLNAFLLTLWTTVSLQQNYEDFEWKGIY